MSNDRYERIRAALAMGPTPGEWYWSDAYRTPDGRKTWSLIGDGGFGILSCDGEENSPQSVNTAAADLIAACDPDTIRALLSERDALAHENEAMRRCAIKYLSWLDVVHKPLDEALREDMANPDMCGDAAIAAANGGGNG